MNTLDNLIVEVQMPFPSYKSHQSYLLSQELVWRFVSISDKKQVTMRDFQSLRDLLNKETFPHLFSFKFIGKNSLVFQRGARNLQLKFPVLVLQSQKFSQNQNHVSFTFTYQAPSVDSIIEVFKAISEIPDLSIIL